MVARRMVGTRAGSVLWGFELADAGRREIGVVRRDRTVNQAYDDLRTAARQFHHRPEPYYIQHRAHRIRRSQAAPLGLSKARGAGEGWASRSATHDICIATITVAVCAPIEEGVTDPRPLRDNASFIIAHIACPSSLTGGTAVVFCRRLVQRRFRSKTWRVHDTHLLLRLIRDSPDADFRRRPCSVPARQARPKGPEHGLARAARWRRHSFSGLRPAFSEC